MRQTYRTNEIAEIGQVHPNTVRVYEEWGYLSPVPRAANGYRVYDTVHVVQLKIARLAFRCELIQNNLRKRATRIVKLSGQEAFPEALIEAKEYFSHLKLEHQYVLEAIEVVKNWYHSTQSSNTKIYTHQQVANKLGITEEVLRNWERNGLFSVERNTKRHRVYYEEDIERLLVIRTLRSAHFSMVSILRLVQQQEDVLPFDIKDILNTPSSTEDILHITDRLELGLREAMEDIKELIRLLSNYLKRGFPKRKNSML
ncbi:MerR family transcriptional regulator [Lysinibacillus sp. NPDC097287]|uniref:MerR family transcriptional regulator n=1 Tax=Lysinibacillus sp. NPDC097287 TaxID=3364144 RepID=UPI0038246717